MKQLFMITLGGKAKTSTIEVHDVQFIIAKNIEETYNILKNNWYGLEKKLHIDSYKIITGGDGYQITIEEDIESSKSDDKKLYLANIGGYQEDSMFELHDLALIVEKDSMSAKNRALKLYKDRYLQPHVDNIFDISKTKLLNTIHSGNIRLTKVDREYNLKPDWFGYFRLDQI